MNTEVRPQQIIDTHVNNSYKPNGNVSETTNDSATAKKESRLKHFFSPIRKKPIIAQAPPIMSQPDVFISNILPSNMYVNPAFHLQNNPSESSSKVDNVVETASPTSSFQVNHYYILNEVNYTFHRRAAISRNFYMTSKLYQKTS